jgi:hypothetical protein
MLAAVAFYCQTRETFVEREQREMIKVGCLRVCVCTSLLLAQVDVNNGQTSLQMRKANRRN